jgi:hypothetical protein
VHAFALVHVLALASAPDQALVFETRTSASCANRTRIYIYIYIHLRMILYVCVHSYLYTTAYIPCLPLFVLFTHCSLVSPLSLCLPLCLFARPLIIVPLFSHRPFVFTLSWSSRRPFALALFLFHPNVPMSFHCSVVILCSLTCPFVLRLCVVFPLLRCSPIGLLCPSKVLPVPIWLPLFICFPFIHLSPTLLLFPPEACGGGYEKRL